MIDRIWRERRFAAAILVTLLFTQVLAASDPGQGRAVYLIALRDAPLVENATKRVSVGIKVPAGGRQAMRDALTAPQSAAYLAQLDAGRNRVIDLASRAIARPLVPTQVYTHAANGMALELTHAEADKIAALAGVASVRRERILHVHTDAGPQWIGADGLWSGQAGPTTKGEGVVIGVIDTGINPTHPSFAATGADGFTHTNPGAGYLGLCASGQAACNGKLIGIYDYSNEGSNGIDVAGHGSHVSAIAAGNAISASLHGMTANLTRNVSGVAPHANLIMYKACNAKPIDASQGDGTCAESWLVKAIDQAIVDKVDVINYSIGGDTVDPYTLLADRSSDAYAFFQARAAGIVIAVAAGNEGPGANTLSEPSNAPWVIGVANASHNRRLTNTLTGTTGTGAGSSFNDLVGQGFTAGYGPAAVVYAGDHGNALCGKGTSVPSPPDGSSNPWPAGTFHGEIVICDRGTYGRVEKGFNLMVAGAGGMILANAASDGESTVSDDHYLPAVHLGYQEGQVIKDWAHSYAPLRSSISGVSAQLDAAFGDVLEASSSRGPYGFSGGVLKPDLTAPGTNILSASNTGNGLALMTGTSMASPHVAGSAALVLAAHHDWTPAQVESALIGSALAGSVRKEDGATLASPSDAGSGRVQPALAANAGLYLSLNTADFAVSDGDLRKLNRPGIEDEHCFQSCSFTRTITDMSGGGTWQVSATATTGAKITVTPSQFTLAAGASQMLDIQLEVSDPHLLGHWVSARVVLHKTAGASGASDIALTAAVFSDPGPPLSFRELSGAAGGGHADLNLAGLPALASAQFLSTTLDAGSLNTLSLGVDATPDAPYDLPKTGVQLIYVPFHRGPQLGTCPGGYRACYSQTAFVVAELSTTEASQARLYAGIDANGDGQAQLSEQACVADAGTASPNAVARCVINLNEVGSKTISGVWVLAQVVQGDAAARYRVDVRTAAPEIGANGTARYDAATDFHTTGPGHVPTISPIPLRLGWPAPGVSSQPPAAPGQRYFGAVLIDGAPGLDGRAGFLPFALTLSDAGGDAQGALHDLGSLPTTLRDYFYLGGGSSSRHRFIDVPPNVSTLVINADLPAGSNSEVRIGVARADFPAFSSSPEIDAAPASTAAWTLAASLPLQATSVPVTPGRWYVTAENLGSDAVAVGLGLKLAAPSPADSAGISPGTYYNPQRSGHGIFVSQGGGQQLVYWYTYLEDGTPTWYSAQAPQPDPAGSVWTAPLYRVNWNGTAVNASRQVGEVTLTRIDSSDMILSWALDGQAGSERLARLGAGPCPNFNGAAANFSGTWYVPTQSGYGLDALALPDQLFTAFYFYDAVGVARWGVGTAQPFAASNALNLTQSTGFCPACAYRKVTSQALGTMTIGYIDTGSGKLSTNFMLQPPLSGTWTVDQQTLVRLTGSPSACTP